MSQPQTVSELLASFQQFLVVLTHQLIYLRGVYPAEAFGQKRVYDIAIQQCRHPKVIEWIENLSIVCMERIREGYINKLSIVFLRESDKSPLERYVLDLSDFPRIPSENQMDRPLPEDVDITWTQIIDQYRSCLRVLTAESQNYDDNDDPLTFTVLLETSEDREKLFNKYKNRSEIDINQSTKTGPWIVADSSKYHLNDDSPKLTSQPIRYIDAGPISFNLYLETDRIRTKQKLAGGNQAK